LLLGRPVAHEGVVHDLVQRAAAGMLAEHVLGQALLLARAREQERERVPEEAREGDHRRGRLYPSPSMRRGSSDSRFAERVVEGVDDGGSAERVVIWIERKPGALWAGGRAV